MFQSGKRFLQPAACQQRFYTMILRDYDVEPFPPMQPGCFPEIPAAGTPMVSRDEALEKSTEADNISVSLSQFNDCFPRYGTRDAISLPDPGIM